MNLSEFLLARIAEDEEAARDALSRPGAAEWLDWLVYDDGARDPAVVMSPRRALAECEAKRRIVEAVLRHTEGEWEDDPIHDWVFDALVLPYVDHPDFRDEWRP